MIIKNMEEFGKAVDEGKELEMLNHRCHRWQPLSFFELEIEKVRAYIEASSIRTKPKTTYYRVIRNQYGALETFAEAEPFGNFGHWANPEASIVFIHDFQIEESS